VGERVHYSSVPVQDNDAQLVIDILVQHDNCLKRSTARLFSRAVATVVTSATLGIILTNLKELGD
jgi:hypothetical protein